MPATETVGASPKKIAAAITALVTPYVIGLLARTFGWELDVGTATAIIGPLVLSAVVFAAAHLAKPGKVYVDQSLYPDAFSGPNPPAKVLAANPDAGPPKKKPAARKKPPAKKARAK